MSDPSHLLRPEVASAFYGAFPRLREAQLQTIKPILAGKDVILSAGTGTGKTEAVMAPLMSRLWREAVRDSRLVLLYIAPTKALVNDVERRLRAPLQALGLKVGIRHGDRDDVAAGPSPHVLITTPESLEVLLFRNEERLGSIRAVVIDEVHLLCNTQRGLQLFFLLNRLTGGEHERLQRVALSATMTDPESVQRFLFDRSRDVVCLSFATTRPIDAHIRLVSDADDFVGVVGRLTDAVRTKLLLFANSRRECERLAGMLHDAPSLQCDVFAHYSSLSADMRVATERRFAESRRAVCIATSTLELGIDIGDIDAVLLWGAPATVESFLQRIGRGNRRSHKTNVIGLVPWDAQSAVQEGLTFLALLDAARAGEIPRQQAFQLFGAAAQQCLAIIAADGGGYYRVRDLCERIFAEHIDRSVIEHILAELHGHGFLQPHGFKNRYGADEKLHELVDFRMIYGNFPANSSLVEVRHRARVLGAVPRINLLRIGPGKIVRFAGKCWRVRKTKGDAYELEPVKPTQSAVDFMYGGRAPGVGPFACDRIWACLHNATLPPADAQLALRSVIESTCRRVRAACRFEDIPYTVSHDGLRYYTFAGKMVNRVICRTIGGAVESATEFSMVAQAKIAWGDLPARADGFDAVLDLDAGEAAEQSIYQRLLPQDLQRAEFKERWLRDGSIEDILARLHRGRGVEVATDVFSQF